uniref:Secreted protein n=1 Tax=Oryzias sinensis TaxID=183150 RepID=A0A8C7WTJ4_9TELE
MFFIVLMSISCFQGTSLARQIGAVAYAECTSKYSENSVRDVFHITTLASVSSIHRPQLKRADSRHALKRVSQQPPRTEIHDHPPTIKKDRAKSCVLM